MLHKPIEMVDEYVPWMLYFVAVILLEYCWKQHMTQFNHSMKKHIFTFVEKKIFLENIVRKGEKISVSSLVFSKAQLYLICQRLFYKLSVNAFYIWLNFVCWQRLNLIHLVNNKEHIEHSSTLYRTIQLYNNPSKESFWKHCGRRRKCW